MKEMKIELEVLSDKLVQIEGGEERQVIARLHTVIMEGNKYLPSKEITQEYAEEFNLDETVINLLREKQIGFFPERRSTHCGGRYCSKVELRYYKPWNEYDKSTLVRVEQSSGWDV